MKGGLNADYTTAQLQATMWHGLCINNVSLLNECEDYIQAKIEGLNKKYLKEEVEEVCWIGQYLGQF